MLERKPQANAKLLNLPIEQKEKLRDWLETGLDYQRAVALVLKEFKVQTSVGALVNFWQSYVAPLRLERRARAAQLSQLIGKDASAQPINWDKALDESLKELAFRFMETPGVKPEEVFFLMQCVYKGKDQALKGADLSLKREKMQMDVAKLALQHVAKLKAIASDKSMDAGERMKQARLCLFGELPKE